LATLVLKVHAPDADRSPSSLSGCLSVPAAILILGHEQRPYLLEEAARQPEPLWCLPRKTRPHGISPMWSSGPRLGSPVEGAGHARADNHPWSTRRGLSPAVSHLRLPMPTPVSWSTLANPSRRSRSAVRTHQQRPWPSTN